MVKLEIRIIIQYKSLDRIRIVHYDYDLARKISTSKK